MTQPGLLLREEIERSGPVSFHRFMEIALYHPEHGYYRRPQRDPFGRDGDFFTAEQVQPAFGILIAQRIRLLQREMSEPEDFTVVELGAGRGEMRESLSGFHYVPVEIGSGSLPASFRGVVFSNEFFDALPVHRVAWVKGEARESLVGWSGERFVMVDGPLVSDQIRDYIERYLPAGAGLESMEVNLDALRWIERIAASLESGFVLTVDYGYTKREALRFPAGTLMSYRRHTATPDVLSEPGERDITAHVNFTALEEQAKRYGLAAVRLESLSRTLLHAGEADQFAAALAGTDERCARLQLKTLLFGMGETFRTSILRKE